MVVKGHTSAVAQQHARRTKDQNKHITLATYCSGRDVVKTHTRAAWPITDNLHSVDTLQGSGDELQMGSAYSNNVKQIDKYL